MIEAKNITTSATVISPANLNRRFISLVNTSNETIFVKYAEGGDALTTANGHPIPPADYIVLKNDGHSPTFRDRVEAIHGGDGNKVLRVQEG
jgi:hypothetical protein